MLTFKALLVFCCFFIIIFSDLTQCFDSEQNYSQNQIHEMIANFTNTMLEVKSMVGGAVAVVKNNQVVYLRGFGRRNLNSSDEVDNHTLFGLASLTKAFTAATLVKVIEDRKDVSQTMPISNFLDIEFSTEQRTKYANVEDLLSHRMGLPKNNYLRLNLELTRDNIPQYVKQFKQYKDFRTSFMYSSIMFGLAAHITEKLTNSTWENMISEKILRPLGMADTAFITKFDEGKKNVATPYVEDNDMRKTLIEVPASFKRKWSRIGSGAIQSSASDMSKWMRFLLNGKRSFLCNIFGTRNFLVQTTNVFRRPKMPVAYINDKYALGWKKGFYRGYPIIVHTGTNWGNNLVLTLFPEEKLGVFVALTGSDFQAYKRTLIMQYVADLYLGNEPWINASSIKDFKVPKYKPKCPNPPSSETNRYYLFGSPPNYKGIYSNSLWGNVTVTQTKSGTLFFTYGFVTFQLFPNPKAFSSFSAKGIGEMRFLKLSSVYFEVCSKRGVVAITIPSFEKLMPPTFWKIT
ncbi:D-alanyl-D-alanine-carboxypeptidase/endopeptidase AmpH [Octopus bimaculoides]|uniref:Beta-lactamase-related domain-containing protein n=1 Tax=Octopus bimaculoides TaxID=37653 RepID=A0A0L8I2P8_OCTBM|nr:D-alanyl-D-alanine-carboxypeptidase/endopeptidase AmpH [Octopus bimaculoides]|eukprot:XP_014791369.1 PREDICTED: D-alanyl-D-alanine-carboxypeptidase/endopeptidase AmpH-like [Octopus bimaculoides]